MAVVEVALGCLGRTQVAKTSETVLGQAVMQVLAARPNGQATMRVLIKRVPSYITLTSEDKEISGPRGNEQIWEQRVRNLKSHDKTEGNILAEGFVDRPARGNYRLTDAGRLHLKNKGLI